MPKKHEVKQGECIQSIAFEHGFFWETIWKDPNNQELKDQRKNPNILLAGDEVTIPEKTRKEENGQTGQRHKFRYRGVPAKLQLRLLDDDGKVRTGLDYVLQIPNGRTHRGKIAEDGWIKVPVLPNVATAHLAVTGEDGQETRYLLELGRIDPIDELSGVQQRLANLGYIVADPLGTFGPGTEEALLDFQYIQGLELTGEADVETVTKLQELYGC